jgi:cytochrome oxidase Cu insertion factor (SCO1/SenC/PrrC family)
MLSNYHHYTHHCLCPGVCSPRKSKIIKNYRKLSKITPEIIVIVKKNLLSFYYHYYTQHCLCPGVCSLRKSKINKNYRKLSKITPEIIVIVKKKICYHSTIITTPTIAFALEFVH